MKSTHDYELARQRLVAGQKIELACKKPRRLLRYIAGASLAAMFAAGFASQGHALALPDIGGQYQLAAAGAWVFYNEAKKYIGSADIDLNGSTFRMSLFTSASNAATTTLSVISEVTNELTEANGYSSSGKAITGVTWTVGASASEYRFSSSAVFWSANGGTISNVKFAVIWITGASAGARKVMVRSTLSTAQFNITAGNRLTITPSANGIFELN